MASKKQKMATGKAAKAPPVENSDSDSDSDDLALMSSFHKAAQKSVNAQKVNTSGGGTNKIRVQGMIIEVAKQMANKRNSSGTIPKKLITIANPQISENGAGDFVGTKFGAYLLPVAEREGSEDGDGGGGANERKVRFLTYPDGPDTRCRQIDGSLSVSLYTESYNKDKETDVGRMKVGDIVEVWNVEAVPGFSTKTGEPTLYVNAGGGKITVEGPPPAFVNDAIKKYAGEHQEYAVFAASTAKHGFFDTAGFNDEQTRQAKIIQKWWQEHRDAASRGFRSLAAGKDEGLSTNLLLQADRLAGHDPAFFAAGNDIVPIERKFDAPVVPLMLFGSAPASTGGNPMPTVLKTLYAARKDETLLASLPKSMLAAVCTQIKFHKEGGTSFTAFFSTVAIPDVHGAVAALKESKKMDVGLQLGPVLASEMTLRHYIPTTGRDPELARMFVDELFMGQVSGSIFLKVQPLIHGGENPMVASDWALGGGIKMEMDKTLEAGAVLVSSSFIKKELCDGATQFVCEREFNAETALQKSTDEDTLKFSTHGIQELTCEAWKYSMFEEGKFKDAQGPVDVEFRVLFSGVKALLTENDDARTDTEAGEKAIAAAAKKVGKKVKDFLAQNTLIYAVAVPQNEETE